MSDTQSADATAGNDRIAEAVQVELKTDDEEAQLFSLLCMAQEAFA